MKKLILFLLFSIVGFAQVPQGMSHRGTAYNSNGTILQNTPIIINVSILNGNGGTAAYTETHNLTTNNNGQYNINIGQGTNPSALFSTIDWSSGDKWLEIKIAPATNPTNFVIGTSQLMSVPYALYAGKTNSIATVEKISELRSQNLHTTGNLVYVKGYWYAGDGGGGYFSYDANNSQNDNDGTIFKPATVTGNGRWIRQYDGYINARFFGVVKEWENPVSGFSNSDQIQKMIDFVSSFNGYNSPSNNNGLTIFFPGGTYYIDKSIVIKDKTFLLGESGTHFAIHEMPSDDYIFELDSGVVNNFKMENFLLDTNFKDNKGAIHLKTSPKTQTTHGGLWQSSIKNVTIINLKGHGIYLEGGDDYKSFNQFLKFEEVRVVRHSEYHNSLKIQGQCGQLTFINCTFDGIKNLGTNVNIIRGESSEQLWTAVLSFINCTFQDSQFGINLEHAENLTIDNCWFETLDLAIQIKNSNAISILGSRFGSSAGFGDIEGSHFPQGTGRCIDIENSSVNIERNYIIVGNPNSTLVEGEKFLVSIGNDNTINLKDNQFSDQKLSQTYGVIQTTTISNNIVNFGSKKNIFINVPSGSSYSVNQINRIDSSIGGGENIFIRANQGPIQINAMDSNGLTNKNIYLSGSSSLILKNGESATFKKIDLLVGNEKCTYQLVSVSKNDDTGWNTSISFSNGVTNYDTASTVRFRNKNGVVYLEGSIKGGATQANGLTYQLFRLPEGFRPSRKCSYTIVRAGNTTGTTPTSTVVGRVDIDANGYVFGVNYSTIWSNLSGISFVVD